MSITDKFLRSTIRPSDLKYSWAVVREHPVDYGAVIDEAPAGKIRASVKLAKLLAGLIRKHTSRRWRYVLYRRSTAVDTLIRELSRKSKTERNEIVANSRNWKVLRETVKSNTAKQRSFSSLAAMQRWADRNGIMLDVYGLYAKSGAKKNG